MTSFSISNLLENPSRFGFIVLIYHPKNKRRSYSQSALLKRKALSPACSLPLS